MYKVTYVRVAGGGAGVDFGLEVDGLTHRCRVSQEALEDQLHVRNGLNDAELIEAFHKVGSQVAEIVARKFGIQSDELLIVTNSDF